MKTEEKYAGVTAYLLGRVIVTENIDYAIKLAKKNRYSLHIVTLEGEYLSPGGSMTGGAFKNSSNLLGRRREMDELSAKVKSYLHKVDELLDEIESCKAERTKVRKDLEAVKGDLQAKFIAQNTARLNVIQAQEKKSEAGKGFERLKEEAKDVEAQVLEIEENKKQIQKELLTSEEEEKRLQAEVAEVQKKLDALRLEENEIANSHAQLGMETEKALQKQGFMQQNVDRINGEIGRVQAELEEILESLTGTKEDMDRKNADIEKLQQTIDASYTSQDENKEKLEADTAKKQELSEKQKLNQSLQQSNDDLRNRNGLMSRSEQEQLEEEIRDVRDQNSKLQIQVNKSSVEAVDEAQKKQKEAEKKMEQAEFKARNEKKRAELEIRKAKKEVKDRTENMKAMEYFWGMGYITVVLFAILQNGAFQHDFIDFFMTPFMWYVRFCKWLVYPTYDNGFNQKIAYAGGEVWVIGILAIVAVLFIVGILMVIIMETIKQYKKMRNEISQMFLIGSLSGIAVLGDVIRGYLPVNLILLFVFVNMGIMLLRVYRASLTCN